MPVMPPDQFYQQVLVHMQHIAEPAYVSYHTTVPSGHTSIVVTTDKSGYAHVVIRASTEIEPQRTWDVAYRGNDGAASIALPAGGRGVTSLALFDPTWRGALRWMRYGLAGDMGTPLDNASPTPAPNGTPPPVIAVVQAIGTSYYQIFDAGPWPCSDGRPGEHLRLVARGDPREHPLTDVIVDLASMRFCTMRFHHVAKTGMNSAAIDIDLHFGDVGGYYLITDGKVTGGVRVFLLAHLPLDATFAYQGVSFPASMPAALFEPKPEPAPTPAPL